MEEISAQITENLPSQAVVSSQEADLYQPTPTKHFFQRKTFAFVSFLILVLTAGSAIYILSKQPAVQKLAYKTIPALAQLIPTPSPTLPLEPTEKSPDPSPSTILTDSVDTQKRIVFLKNPNRETYDQIEVWTMNPDGSNQQKLELSKINSAYKQPDSSLVFYTTSDSIGSVFVKNLNTSEVQKIKPVEHPDKNVTVGLSLDGLDGISPDGKYFLFSADFSFPCPSPTSGPVPQEGGPCMPDPLQELPSGKYLYDLVNQTRTPLKNGDFPRVARWDTEHQKVYLINDGFHTGGLDEMDLGTKQVKRIDNATTFGYGAFPLLSSNGFIRVAAETGSGNDSESFSTISYVNRTENKTTKFDDGKWADIQPFAAISPDEKYILYERTQHLPDGKVADYIQSYDPRTNTTKRISPETIEDGYTVRGVWTDSHTFVTMVYTIEKENYYNGNNYLVNIDLDTGKITRLTPKDDVYQFMNP